VSQWRNNSFRWRPQFAKSRPLPAPVLRVCPPPTGGGEEEGEEYDALTPLPLIPGLKRVGSLPLVPSAPEQRREVSLPDLSQYRYSLPDLSQYGTACLTSASTGTACLTSASTQV
jgi:hypothetical protein